jgi:hypothetical protein
MSRIWISYRPTDGKQYVRRLHEALTGHFGGNDISLGCPAADLDPDVPFILCKILLVVIGQGWSADSSGRRYLDDPEDTVRMTVAMCFVGNASVVPVLVNGAVLPGLADLPEDLANLAVCKSVVLRDQTFAYDLDILITRLEVLLAGTGLEPANEEILIRRFAGKYRRQDIHYGHAEALWLDTTLSITDRRLVFESHGAMGTQLRFLNTDPQQSPTEIALSEIVDIAEAQSNAVQIVTKSGSEHVFIPFGVSRQDLITSVRSLVRDARA